MGVLYLMGFLKFIFYSCVYGVPLSSTIITGHAFLHHDCYTFNALKYSDDLIILDAVPLP